MGLFSFLGLGKNSIREAIRRGGVIIDVRTGQEFDRGRVPGAINIPVDRLAGQVERIKAMKRPVILVCSSGSRSEQARQMLKSAGLNEVYNGGSWERVLKML